MIIMLGADIGKGILLRYDPIPKHAQEVTSGSVVEAPLALLEVEVEVLLWDAVVAAQVPFGLVPAILDTVDVAVARNIHGHN